MAEWAANSSHSLSCLESRTDRIEELENGFPVEDPGHLNVRDTSPKSLGSEPFLELAADVETSFPAHIVQSIEDFAGKRTFAGKVTVFRVEGFGWFDRKSRPSFQDIRQGSLTWMPLAQVRMLSTKGSDD